MTDSDEKVVSILLVEDDDIDAMNVQRSIRKMQLLNPVVRAVDGIEALDILRGSQIKRPFITLLDLNLPRMGGMEFLKTIRADDQLKDSIVFIVTTSSNDEEIAAAYRKNVAGYIVKSSFNQDFSTVLSFLQHYWRLVRIPS